MPVSSEFHPQHDLLHATAKPLRFDNLPFHVYSNPKTLEKMLICNDGFGMIEDFVPSLFLVAFVGVFVYVTNRKDSDETHDNWKEMFGPMGFQVLILTLILMWIFPGGILFIGPILLVLSILSPAGRIAWKEYRQPRSIVSLGFPDEEGEVVLIGPKQKIPNGGKLF